VEAPLSDCLAFRFARTLRFDSGYAASREGSGWWAQESWTVEFSRDALGFKSQCAFLIAAIITAPYLGKLKGTPTALVW
jgi:hypothetical protein